MKRILLAFVMFALPSFLLAQTEADTVRHEVLLETNMGNIRVALYNDTPLHRDNFLKLTRSGYYNGCIFQRVIKNFMIQGGDPASRKVFPDGSNKLEKLDTAYTVPAEILFPKYYHKRGQLCMARENDDVNPQRASAPCDFYITWGRNYTERQIDYLKFKTDPSKGIVPTEEVWQGYLKYGGVPHLDGKYTVFGEVLEGMDVVDKIQNVATNKEKNDHPLEDVIIQKASVVK